MKGIEDIMYWGPRTIAPAVATGVGLDSGPAPSAERLPAWMASGFIVVASVCLWAVLIGGACAVASASIDSAGAILAISPDKIGVINESWAPKPSFFETLGRRLS